MKTPTQAFFQSMIILMVLKIALLGHVPAVMANPTVSGFINAIGGYAMEHTTLGYEPDTMTFTKDSLLGLQVSQDITPRLSATGQLVARGEDDFKAEAAWAYLSYRLSDAAQFRMGRFRTPFFLFSDYLDVGYAQHWISAPDEVYALQFDSVDGMDLSYSRSFGRLDSKIQLYVGSSQEDFTLNQQNATFDIRLREQMGIIGTVHYGWLTARASFHQATRLSIDNFSELPLPAPLDNIANLKDAVIALDTHYDLGADRAFLLDHLDVQNVAAEFTELALRMQWTHFFILGEGTLLTFNDSPLAKQRRHLVSAGISRYAVTVFTTYARANDEPVNLAASLASVPDTQNLRTVLRHLSRSLALESESVTFGLRYDLEAGAAFKMEITENKTPQNDPSNLVRFGFQLVF